MSGGDAHLTAEGGDARPRLPPFKEAVIEPKVDRRKIKPLCALCGQEHWRFVKCDDADIQNARERVAAVRRERAKVYPEYRNKAGRLEGDKRASWNTDYARPKTPPPT